MGEDLAPEIQQGAAAIESALIVSLDKIWHSERAAETISRFAAGELLLVVSRDEVMVVAPQDAPGGPETDGGWPGQYL